MKKMVPLLFLLILFNACSEDDNNTFNESNIVNKWYITASTLKEDPNDYSKGYTNCETGYFEFHNDKKYREVVVTECNETTAKELNYNINGKQLTIGDTKYDIIELTKTKLKIKTLYRYFVTPANPIIYEATITYKPIPQQ